jgi:hypothetical protein
VRRELLKRSLAFARALSLGAGLDAVGAPARLVRAHLGAVGRKLYSTLERVEHFQRDNRSAVNQTMIALASMLKRPKVAPPRERATQR